MANIGSFTRNADGFSGTIKTAALSLKARLVPVPPSEKGPSFRIIAGTGNAPIELGAAWSRTARETGMPYLSCRLDDPTWSGPIFASLVEDAKGDSHSLIWSRPRTD